MSPTIGTGVDRMVQQVQQRDAIRSSPLQFASVHAAVRTDRHLHVVPDEPLQQAVDTAAARELREDQT